MENKMVKLYKRIDDRKTNTNANILIVGTITPRDNEEYVYFYSSKRNYLYAILDKLSNNRYKFEESKNNLDEIIEKTDRAGIVFFDTYKECEKTKDASDSNMKNIILSDTEEFFSLLKKYKNINKIYTTSGEARKCIEKIIIGLTYNDRMLERFNVQKTLIENIGREIEIIDLFSPSQYAVNHLGGERKERIDCMAKKWLYAGFNELSPKYDTLEFGKYYRKQDPNDKEPLAWYILEKNDTYTVLITKEIIDEIKYGEYEQNDWETSYLRKWLNNEFYLTAFSDNEKNMIIRTNDENVSILSVDEYKKYYEQNPTIGNAEESEYAKVKYKNFYSPYKDVNRKYYFWWTRTPNKVGIPNSRPVKHGAENEFVFHICDDSNINGYQRPERINGVRPVIKIKTVQK